ncbi:MAG TPA: serine/threonine-protein kinase [Thermoanaerobaculia bacterium]|nr:serine/threonine-protein kinase [Thermoanaerobaculia bacterium]
MTAASGPGTRRLALFRFYAIACAIVTLPLAPVFFATLGRVRHHPIDLNAGIRRADGSVALREHGRVALVVDAVRIGNQPWLRPASAAVGRQLRNLPAGTTILYRIRDVHGARTVGGPIVERARSGEELASRLVMGLLALAFVFAGFSLALAARSGPPLLGAGFLSGAGFAIGFFFLEPNAVLISSWPWRNALVVAVSAVPRGLGAWFLVCLLASFPARLPIGIATRLITGAIGLATLVHAALLVLAQLPIVFESLPWRLQLGTMNLLESNVLQNVPYLAAAGLGVTSLVRQMRRVDRGDKDATRRTQLVTIAFAIGCSPALVAIVVQAAALLTTGHQILSSVAMAVSLLPLLLVPAALTYALLSRRADSLGVLVRRALLFAIAGNTIRGLTLLPCVVLLALLYQHRHESLRDLLTTSPFGSLLAVLGAVLGLRYSDRIHEAVERIFFRERQDARRILRELADMTRHASDAPELVAMITAEMDKALHLESVALFLRNPKTQMLVPPPRKSFPAIDVHSTIATMAARADDPMTVDLSDPRSPFLKVSEVERQWLDEGDFRLLVPFLATNGSLLALLGLGEKLNELPFDKEDRLLLSAVAASSSLALENYILRSSPPSTRTLAGGEPDADEAGENASICPSCSRLYSSTQTGARCPVDDSELGAANVPYILAGKFRFEIRIGTGGMGVVYRARDLTLGRSVAIKTLPKLSASAAARLQREARAVANLIHPNIATVFAAENWRSSPMLVFEYLDNGTLARRIRNSPLPVDEVIACGLAICLGLEEAHRQGILHRDIKPSNVGFTANGATKILDFGLARFLEDTVVRQEIEHHVTGFDQAAIAATTATLSTGIVGTPAYLSPEAIMDGKPDPDFDIWSVTLTLYEALVGRNPFFDVSPERTFNRILSHQVPDPRKARPECPDSLAALLQVALGKAREARPRTARDLREQLQAL